MIDNEQKNPEKVAVVIPSYKVKLHISAVISSMPDIVSQIYVVDDKCPEETGKYVEETIADQRVKVIYHKENLGVGGAVMTGYQRALEDGFDIVIKIDGDGQMDPQLIPYFISPILSGEADYAKGNRFYDITYIGRMPTIRIIGNALLSFMSKLSSGYWYLFDPTNGYTAVHRDVIEHLPMDKISRRYFFESDMLFRLNILRAVVVDIPMTAKYGGEVSNLKVRKVMGEFFVKHLRNFGKRIFYNYYLRDLSLASIELPVGLFLFFFGVVFGGYHWYEASSLGVASTAGTVMLSVLPILMGLQLLLAFIGYDISSAPRRPFHRTKVRHASIREGRSV